MAKDLKSQERYLKYFQKELKSETDKDKIMICKEQIKFFKRNINEIRKQI